MWEKEIRKVVNRCYLSLPPGYSGEDRDLGGLVQWPTKCPRCRTSNLWRDGRVDTKFGEVQRFSCRNCGYHFTHWEQLYRKPPLEDFQI